MSLKRELDFAPISSQPSTRLRLAGLYLGVNGGLVLVALSRGGVLAIAGNETLRSLFAGRPVDALVAAVSGVGLLVAGRDLARKRRRGAWAALAAFVAPVVTGLLAGGVAGETLVIGVIGSGVVARMGLSSNRAASPAGSPGRAAGHRLPGLPEAARGVVYSAR